MLFCINQCIVTQGGIASLKRKLELKEIRANRIEGRALIGWTISGVHQRLQGLD